MSYDIELVGLDGQAVSVDRHAEGGTYVMGGTTRAELNVTYNYAWFYYRVLDAEEGIRWLYGKRGGEVVDRLRAAVEDLGTRRYRDYWAPTPGNAGAALETLLRWAEQHPDAVFRGG